MLRYVATQKKMTKKKDSENSMKADIASNLNKSTEFPNAATRTNNSQ